MHIKKSLFHYKMCHNLKKNQRLWRKIFHADADLYLLDICTKFIEKVTRNKGLKDKKVMFKYTFMEVLPFMFKAWKRVAINYANN